MKVYIAGPMTGIPQHNIPLFDYVAKQLRKQGYNVVSPAELDDPVTREVALRSPDGAPGSGSANGETWGNFLARDVKLIADGGIEGIVLLPNWWKSRGATLEATVGLLNKLKFFYWQTEEELATPLHHVSVVSAMIDGWSLRGNYQ